MAITYPLTFPTTIGISSFRMGLRNAVGRLESPFSLSEQVIRYSGQLWEIEVTLPNIRRDIAEDFNAFILKLGGKFGTFLIGDPNGAAPRGSWGGTPLVKGAGQTGDTLIIDGLPNSITGVAKAGDYIQIGTGSAARLYKLVDDANSNGSGEATLTIQPRLRESPTDNAAIIYTNAMGVFRMNQNLIPFSINSNSIYAISFKATEAL